MRKSHAALALLSLSTAAQAQAPGAQPLPPGSAAPPPPAAVAPVPAPPPAPPPGYVPYPYAMPYPYPYAPPGAQAYPQYPQPYPYAPPPPVIDDEGQALPPGYHRETRPRRGPVIGGWITFGIFYGITATVGLNARNEGLLVLPVAGPLIRSASRDCTSSSDCEASRVLYMYSFLGQATGAGLLILGYGSPNKVFVRDAGAVRVLPMLSPQASGLTAIGAF